MKEGLDYDNWSGPAARTEDPPESHEAAAKVDAETDRAKVLAALKTWDRPATARWIAEQAVLAEGGSLLDTARVESLRRRVSDLKKLGKISRVGKYKGCATYFLTP